MNTIARVLVIAMNGAYCAQSVKIQFDTEAECEKTLAKVQGKDHRQLECRPEKVSKK